MNTKRFRPFFLALILSVLALAWSERPIGAKSSSMMLHEAIVEKDAELNIVYKKLMASIPSASQREQLKVSQRAWLNWLTAEESLIGGLRGNKYALSTRLELLSARVQQFEDLLRDSADFQGR